MSHDWDDECEGVRPVGTDAARAVKVMPSARPVRLPVVVVDIPQAVARQDAVFGDSLRDY
jgi:hypothetical protein